MKKLLSKKYTINTCALTAICYASKKDEETIIRMCIAHNFKFQNGLTDRQWMKIARITGLSFKSQLKEKTTLGKFISKHKKGCYFVSQADHLFVVDDSIIYDPRTKYKNLPGLKRVIVQAWKIIHRPEIYFYKP